MGILFVVTLASKTWFEFSDAQVEFDERDCPTEIMEKPVPPKAICAFLSSHAYVALYLPIIEFSPDVSEPEDRIVSWFFHFNFSFANKVNGRSRQIVLFENLRARSETGLYQHLSHGVKLRPSQLGLVEERDTCQHASIL